MPEAHPVNGDDLAELLKNTGFNSSGTKEAVQAFILLSKLPSKVKARVSALKSLQVKFLEVESAFYAKVHELEKQFEAELDAVYEQRRKIVSGEYEPSADEAKLPLIHGATEMESEMLNMFSEADNGEKGIPGFWLNVLKPAHFECDEPILKYLTDITSTFELSPASFTLHFHFGENPYFKNSVLKKVYKLRVKPDAEYPFDYEGPAITESIGDKIEWNEGRDVTKKVIETTPKKGDDGGKCLAKTVKANSFFHFFDSRKVPADYKKGDEDDKTVLCIRSDFELGQKIRNRLIPRAVLYYTGEKPGRQVK